MGRAGDVDHAPLLPPGRHPMDLMSIEALCVRNFEANGERAKLFKAFEKVVDRIEHAKIPCEILTNGSFVTEKLEPADIDIVVRIDSDVSEDLNDDQRFIVDELSEATFAPGVDSFVEVVFPRGHDAYGKEEGPSWEAHYGLERSEKWLKGIVVLRLGETSVGLRLRR